MSEFAGALFELITFSGKTRTAWAQLLCVPPSVVTAWLKDRAIPSSDRLYLIVVSLRGVPESREVLDRFMEMAEKPSRVVSPHGRRMHPTVAQYMLEPLRESLLAALATLPSTEQEATIDRFIRVCHDYPQDNPRGNTRSGRPGCGPDRPSHT